MEIWKLITYVESFDHNPFQVTFDRISDHNLFQATSDESSDHNPFQATSNESSDHNHFQVTSDESSDHNPFHVTSDESSYHNPFQVSTGDTLKSSSKYTCSFDSTWEQKKDSKAIKKLENPKSRSKHLAPTTPRTWSTSTTLLVPTKRPPPVTNYALGLAAVKTWQQILNREFGIKKAKEDVGGSSYVRRKGKRKML
ncbi:hypothetical protein Tco_1270991 [Tanacetum coccineum]